MVVGVAEASLKQISRFRKDLKLLEPVNDRALDSALIGVGDFMRKNTKQYISTQGRGSWTKPHPLSRRFRIDRTNKIWKKKTSRKPLRWLSKYIKFIPDLKRGSIRISLAKERAPKVFGRGFLELAEQVQKERLQKLKPKEAKALQKKFGATRLGRQKAKSGRGFFPIEAGTIIKVPKRDIFDSAFKLHQHELPREYEKRFIASFNRNLNRRFIKGFFIKK